MKVDGQAFVNFLTTDPGCLEVLGSSPLVVFGRSIGGAVGVHVARFNQDKLAGMIVENTFTNLEAMAGVIYPLLAPLLPLLLKDKWWSNRLVGDIALPMLFLSAGRDEIVPPVQMQALVHLARKARSDEKGDADTIELFSIPEGTHNDCFLRGGEDAQPSLSPTFWF
jgi:alpha-beta hydrolase superfamily lysophospholipase